MTGNNLHQNQMKLRRVIPLILLSLAAYPLQVQAQVSHQPTNTQHSLAQLKFPNNGAPYEGRRKGGARRGSCPQLKTPITALVPGEETSSTDSKSFLASTISEYPTFWIYIPDLPTTLSFGEFQFQDEQGNNIWQTPITLPRKAGAIGISLPPNPQSALKINNKYQWYFKVYCGAAQKTSDYFYINAWIQRVVLTPNLENKLKTAKPREYTIYATNNIWYDAVTNLAQTRRANPGSFGLVQDWTKLLQAVGLPELAQTPIFGRYGSER